MNTRKNHADLSAAEKAAYVSAVLALKNKVKSVLKPGKMRRYDPTSDPYLPTSGTPGYDLASKLVFNKAGKPAPWAGSWKVQDTLDTTSIGYVYA